MRRAARTFIVILFLAFVAGAGIVLLRSDDPIYTAEEWIEYPVFHRYDAVIKRVAEENHMDPMLLKAVIWRESGFQKDMVGKDGERGLMQVTEGAAADWAKAQKNSTFVPNDLFDPVTNIEIGAWYLKQSLDHYSGKDDPIPFALAEYNAGRGRMNKWIGENNLEPVTANNLRQNISFPSTRAYVDAILDRYHFYKQRGRI